MQQDFTRNRVLGSLGCSSELMELIRQAGVDDEFGGNIIRHSMMTKLRQEGASLLQVNEFTRYAPGSSVYQCGNMALIMWVGLYGQYWKWGCDGVSREWKGYKRVSARVDGDQFGSNPLVGSTSGQLGLLLDRRAPEGMMQYIAVVCYLVHITHAVDDGFRFGFKCYEINF
ncbi:MAG: hypothetical protein EZS28_030041 [Streblomastix strix]|uniref:Uncharacterized protein n=1 Tax=Streblomastix strix TaxID=222440 RepID=A0A5J4UXH1_9EUKA|nr:MAG: hypothetical protein EZS28_030041 [Streblomastix strix]